MKRLIIATVLIATATPVLAQVYTNGYQRQNGTYVQPYQRTAPDGNFYNNYSAQGNVNPYTGQPGQQTYQQYQREQQREANPYGYPGR